MSGTQQLVSSLDKGRGQVPSYTDVDHLKTVTASPITLTAAAETGALSALPSAFYALADYRPTHGSAPALRAAATVDAGCTPESPSSRVAGGRCAASGCLGTVRDASVGETAGTGFRSAAGITPRRRAGSASPAAGAASRSP
jgi:hypothetical protein